MIEIIIAPSSGFCYGVARAVKLAEENAPCCTLGPLMHNRRAVEELALKGVAVIESPDELPEGGTLVIRAHGAKPELYAELKRRGIKYIDATCPDVARVHRLAAEESAAGRHVLLFGDPNHPEVQATAAWGNCTVITDAVLPNCFDPQTPLTIAAQTTANRNDFKNCCKNLKKQYTNLKILDTICGTTETRQRDARELSRRVDAMVVVGDPASANTRHLADACGNTPLRMSGLADNSEQAFYPLSWIHRYRRIGVVAGASTPSAIIEEVVTQMTEEIKNTETIPESDSETSDNFADMIDATLRPLHTGDKVTGIVIGISPTEIQVDLGSKHAAYIPLSELTDDPNADLTAFCKVGDEIETYVMRVNDVEGTVMLSKRRLDTVKSWEDVEAAQDTRAILEGIVVEENKGGLVVSIKGVRVFVPASQTGLPKDAPLSSLLKKQVRLRITEFHRSRRRVVGSIRSVSQEERRTNAEDLWNTIEVGKEYSGVVKSMAAYGAFVDIGGIDGLLHLSEISWQRVKSPSDVLKVGDEISVTVIAVDHERRRISLRHRKAEDDPWLKFMSTYKLGDVVSVRVNKLMPFGAFAEILPGVDGLIHISQITDRRINRPADAISEGDKVSVKITDIDTARKKVSLSARALLEREPAPSDSGPDEIVATADGTDTIIAEDLAENEE